MTRSVLGGFAGGALLMYFADPHRGRRRRAAVRDRGMAGWRDLTRELDKAGRDIWNRSHGLASGVSSLWRPANATAQCWWSGSEAIGRAVSHLMRSLASGANGRVVLRACAAMRWVTSPRAIGSRRPEVVNRLVHREPDIPSLQEGVRRALSSSPRRTDAVFAGRVRRAGRHAC
jgi:hypothetical protein